MDGPASPVEKFFTLEENYKRLGKAWDPAVIKDVLIDGYISDHGWKEDDPRLDQLRRVNSEPRPADPARARRDRMADREEERSRRTARAAAAKEAARRSAEASTPEDLAAENARLRALLDDPQEPAPPVDPNDEAELPESEEDLVLQDMAQRNRKQILEWAEAQGVEVPRELTLPGKTKMALVEFILEQLDAQVAKEA